MLKLGFVQVNFSVGPKEKKAYYLPYSVGVLWEYAKTKRLHDYFEVEAVIYKREPIEKVAKKLIDCDVVAFSTYIWNKSYHYALAAHLKKTNPEITIVFGGPELPIERENLFHDFPFVDVAVKKEGEIVFSNLLKQFADDPNKMVNVQGILLNEAGRSIDTGAAVRISDLHCIHSPYLNGFFDEIMSDPDVSEWNMTLETDRGCPFACTFCDWGSLTYNKVRKFELDRVFKELEWAGKNNISYISMTNANFGLFPERDSLIADKIIEVQDKYGFPYTFSTAWAKNQRKEVIDIVNKLIKSPTAYNQGLTVSVQSMDDRVLTNIKRKNMQMNNMLEVFRECEAKNIPVYTELILGLPGETLSTWKENFYELFRMGNHTGITVFQAQLLENSEMFLSQVDEFNIQHSIVYDYMEGDNLEDIHKEGVMIVTSNDTMSFDAMLEAQIWSWFMMTFHIGGISNYVARFLKQHHNVSYSTFYERLFECLPDWWLKERDDTKDYFVQWMREGEIDHPVIEGVKILGWNLIYRSSASIQVEKKIDYTFDFLDQFLTENFELDPIIQSDLMEFQKNFLINYEKIDQYPRKVHCKTKILQYLTDGGTLKHEPTEYTFDFKDDTTMSMGVFIKYLYFFRRRNFGKAWISSNTQDNEHIELKQRVA